MFFPDTKLSAFYPSRNPNQHLQSSESSSGSNSRNDRNRTAGGSWGFQLVKLAVLRRELPRPTSGEIKMMMMTLLSPWEAVAFAVWLCDYNYLIRPSWQYSQLARTNIRDLQAIRIIDQCASQDPHARLTPFALTFPINNSVLVRRREWIREWSAANQ